MLSVAATEYSPCIFDAHFSATRTYPEANYYVLWRLNNIFIRASDSQFDLRNSGNTYVLYVSSLRRYMAGTVTCEIYFKTAAGKSQLVEKKTGKLSVLCPVWFEKNTASQILFLMSRTVAYLPYVCGEHRPSASIKIDNQKNTILYFVGDWFVDGNISTLLTCYIYRFHRKITYIKLVYNSAMIHVDAIRVSLKSGMKFLPLKKNTYVQIKWTFAPPKDLVYTFEVTSEDGTFPEASPLQLSKREGCMIAFPDKQKLICCRVRITLPLPGVPLPDRKKIALRSAPVPAPDAVAGPSKRFGSNFH